MMATNAVCLPAVVALVFAAACGGSVQGSPTAGHDGQGTGSVDALVGTWTFHGHEPAIVDVTLTFRSDGSFTMAENVAPPTLPAGTTPTSCITTDTYAGTYTEGPAGSTGALTLAFTGGTANAISGCSSAAPGTPMTPDAIASYRAQGDVPAETNLYVVTADTLTLTPAAGDPRYGGLANQPTTYTRAP